MEYDITDWAGVCEQFTIMFQNLGEITVKDDYISYSSIKPHVLTGIMVTKNGQLIASMPLHNVDSSFTRVIFDNSLNSIRLIGNTFDYTYTIPSTILQLRARINS